MNKNLTKIKDTTQNSSSALLHWNRSTEFRETFYLWRTSCVDMYFYRKCWFDLFKEQFISLLNFGQNYFVQLRWIWFSVRLPLTNAWNCHSLYTAFSSNGGAWGMWACLSFINIASWPQLKYMHIMQSEFT